MKTKSMLMIAGLLLFLIPALPASDSGEARAILEKTLTREYQDLTLKVKLVKTSKLGREREMELLVLMKKDRGVTKIAAEFTSPEVVRGIKSLSWDYPDREPDRWFRLAGMDYAKCVGRACQRMEDRFGFSMEIFTIKLDEANHRLLGDEQVDGAKCYKIESAAKNPDRPEGSRFIAWIDKRKFAARKVEAYDQSGALVKSSFFNDFALIGDHWWETRGWLDEHDTGRKTRFEILEWKLNTGLSDELFVPPDSYRIEKDD